MILRRRTHSKATTGCRTCKSRRKKCDEARPNCRRCLASGRDCFYPCDPISWTTRAGEISRKGSSDVTSHARLDSLAGSVAHPLTCNVSHLSFSSDRERLCVEFFIQRTGPELFGYFGSSVWFESVIRIYIGNGDATVKAAMVALGAAHRVRELDITPTAFQFCEIAQSAYTEALKRLNCSLNLDAASSSIVVPLLLYAFELFWGNVSSAETHMTGWLKMLLARCRRTTRTSLDRYYEFVTTESMYDLFEQLENAIISLLPSNSPQMSSVQIFTDHSPDMAGFQDLRDVCSALFSLLRTYRAGPRISVCLTPERASRRKFILELFSWNCAFAEYLKTQRAELSPHGEMVVAALRIYREAASLLSFIHSQPGLCIDAQLGQTADLGLIQGVKAHFSRIKVRARCFMEEEFSSGKRMSRPSLIIDSGIISPCLLDSQRVISTNLLRQLTSMISTSSLTSVDWQKWGAYNVAEKIADVEESLILPLIVEDPQDQPIAVEVLLYMDDRRLLLRQCVPDLMDGALVWTQQWCSF